jgi:hypothetical protein
MFTLDMAADCVVPREGARAVGTGDSDALMALTDVCPEVCLIAVGSFTERTS